MGARVMSNPVWAFDAQCFILLSVVINDFDITIRRAHDVYFVNIGGNP